MVGGESKNTIPEQNSETNRNSLKILTQIALFICTLMSFILRHLNMRDYTACPLFSSEVGGKRQSWLELIYFLLLLVAELWNLTSDFNNRRMEMLPLIPICNYVFRIK